MKSYFYTLLFCLCTLVVSAQDKKPEEKPVIEFNHTTFDMGKVFEGRPAGHEFIFTNKGKVPLVLSNVQPGCGCTTPEWPKEPIMPGKQAKIKAVYNPGAYKGEFNKGISVYSNASNGTIQLTIKGTVEAVPVEPQSPVKLQQEGGF